MNTVLYLRNGFLSFTIITATLGIVTIWAGDNTLFPVEFIPTCLIIGLVFGISWISILIHRLIMTFAK